MIYTDKYFTKSKIIAEKTGNDPVVKYRVFGRFDGIAALNPVKTLIKILAPTAKIEALPEGTPFSARDTILTIEDKFTNIVELETLYLQWIALPCFCANKAKQIVDAAVGKEVMDFHARHLYGDDAVALASYGAKIGGMQKFSTDIGANALDYLYMKTIFYKQRIEEELFAHYPSQGVGTTPHALIAIHRGNYVDTAKSYLDTLPDDNFVALIDYNNREVDDTLLLLKEFEINFMEFVLILRENVAQGVDLEVRGVVPQAVQSLRMNLDKNDGQHVKIFVSSGFGYEKTAWFMEACPTCFDGIGTGSFIPKDTPTCTSDIMYVSGERECKKGREWGYEKEDKFYSYITHITEVILNPGLTLGQ